MTFVCATRPAAYASPVAIVFLVILLPLISPTHAMVANQPVQEDPLTPTERAWLAEHPVLRMAPSPSYPPVDFFDEEGHHSGYVADVFALIQERLGIRFEVVHLTREKMLLQRPELMEIDVVPLSASTEGRRQNWLFGDPYLEFPAVIITRTGSGPQLLEPEDLAGMTVAVVEGYAVQSHLLTRYPRARLQPVLDTETGLRNVALSRVDAFVSDLPVAVWYIDRMGLSNLRVAGELDYVYRMGISVRKDWPELHGILAKGLALVTPAEHQAIREKWIHLQVRSAVSRRFWLGLISTALLLAIVVGGVLYWNRSLSRQVAERTAELSQELVDRRRAQEEREGLIHELNHRVKNNLATVLAMCEQTFSASSSLDAFRQTYTSRLRAMARVHEALSNKSWLGLPLSQVLKLIVDPYVQRDPERLTAQGDEVALPARVTTPLGLALNELATNAAKHGALSTADGKIDVRWSIDRDGLLEMTWVERDGPQPDFSAEQGVGLGLVRGLIEYELGGEVQIEFESQGMRCRLRVPVA